MANTVSILAIDNLNSVLLSNDNKIPPILTKITAIIKFLLIFVLKIKCEITIVKLISKILINDTVLASIYFKLSTINNAAKISKIITPIIKIDSPFSGFKENFCFLLNNISKNNPTALPK